MLFLTKKSSLCIALVALLLVGISAAWYWKTVLGIKCTFPAARNYTVFFRWQKRMIELHAIDLATGREDLCARHRRAVWTESASIAEQIAAFSRLDSVEGSFSLSLLGCGEPYLTKWSDVQLPLVSDLLAAAETWNVPELRRVLAKGINADARDFRNHTGLMLAASDPRRELQLNPNIRSKVTWEPDISAVEILLAAGADPNARGNYGVTPLMLASNSTTSILIESGANVNARDDFGTTPLMYMAKRDQNEAMRFGIGKGADVQAKDARGWTALMYAAEEGSVDSLRILLKAGADKNAKNGEGQTARAIAVERAKRQPRFRRAVDLLS